MTARERLDTARAVRAASFKALTVRVTPAYDSLRRHGASAAVLQEIAWVTYLGNVYEEEQHD